MCGVIRLNKEVTMFTATLPAVFQNTFRPILKWRLRAVKAQILRAREQQESELSDEVWEDRETQIIELEERKRAIKSRLGLA